MGAMQAQDFAMSKWAIGVRLPGSTLEKIDAAINAGKIVRTHLLRPTWHLAAAEDVHWMLKLSAHKIRAAMKARDKELGLTEDIFEKSHKLFEKTLAGGIQLSRDVLVNHLEKANIAVNGNRASHIFLRAETEGILCSGGTTGSKQNYALLDEWVPKPRHLTHDEALGELAKRYFTSHAPATFQDFVWWSGLSINQAKPALEIAKPNFVSETIGNQIYWFPNSSTFHHTDIESLYLIPAFDEFIISYANRSASLPADNHIKAVSSNRNLPAHNST